MALLLTHPQIFMGYIEVRVYKPVLSRNFQIIVVGRGWSWQYAKQQRPVATRMSVDSGRDLEAPPTGFRYLPPRVTAVLAATPVPD